MDGLGHSYGITSDPLTQFAIVFSALMHDANHPGVPNAVLVQEQTVEAQRYRQSIAEQHSIDLVWKLLLSPAYTELRSCIYRTPQEFQRFRQLVVNTVLATDIVDKDLNALRKARWEVAFAAESSDTGGSNSTTTPASPSPLVLRQQQQQQESPPVPQPNPEQEKQVLLSTNRKATIVIEHLIQASDVAHTMQHWQVYRTWNERFFLEMYHGYCTGRSATGTDPSLGWYQGEIGFFTFISFPWPKSWKIAVSLA